MEAWVTPGRFKVPHLQTVWNPTTQTWSIEEVNTNPYNYPALSVDSQAYKNITTGIPTDFNQFEGCPVGHKMGPDGVCRPIPGYIAPPATDPSDPSDPTDPTDPEDTTGDPFRENTYTGGNNQQTDPYKDYMASIGTNQFASTGNDYSALPGGLNNWTDEAFYDWGLDKGYITESGIGGPQESKLKFGVFNLGQYMNDKKFQFWKDSAIERGILREFREKHPTEGIQNKYELLKKRGSGDGFGGGGLINITKNAEATWNEITETPLPIIDLEFTPDDDTPYPYQKKEVQYTKTVPSVFMESIANAGEAELEKSYLNDWIEQEEARQNEWNKTGFYTNEFGKKFGPGPDLGIERQKGLEKIKSYEEQIKDIQSKLNSGFYDNLGPATKTQIYDPLLKEFVDFDPGLDVEGRRRDRAKKLRLGQQQEEANKIKPKFKPEGMFFIGTSAGDKANNMTKAQTGQYIGASVYKSPDKASNVGGHYQQNGKFVDSNGTVVAFGSMSDSIYAMANGTAVNKVLNRTFKSKGSTNVMKKEAKKMLDAGKLTKAEYDKVTSYNSKSDYQNDTKHKNKTIYENGTVTTQGSGTTGTTIGAAGGGTPTGGGGGQVNSGNTGSGSKKDKIICTEMYRQTNLNDWKEAMKLWYLFQKKHLTPTHQVGYHFLFKPFVRGMKKSKILTAIGSHFAKQRTKDIKHIMFGTKFSLLGRIYRIIFEPICYITGLILTRKEKLAWQ
tara:strand:- start:1546 stop:3726 length:2181 start_codon:yes stop_codon:yes gene_type:complete